MSEARPPGFLRPNKLTDALTVRRLELGNLIEDTAMRAESNCIKCDVKRTRIGVTPVENRHEMLSFECPKCGSLFRLVAQRERRFLAEEAVFGHSPDMAAAQ